VAVGVSADGFVLYGSTPCFGEAIGIDFVGEFVLAGFEFYDVHIYDF
jgi:hypothetical protein